MALDEFVIIASLILAVAGYIGYRYGSDNVYLKHKEQRAWMNNTKEALK